MFQEINIPSDDGISSLHFLPETGEQLCVTAWSGNLTIYSLENLEKIFETKFPSPLLCSTWSDDQDVVCGAADGKLYTKNGQILQKHTQGVCSVGFIKAVDVFFSASWDGYVHFWFPGDEEPLHSHNVGQKIVAACSNSNHVVVCTAKNTVVILDLTKPEAITVEQRISSLQMQIRAICPSYPEEYGWAVSSIDGRVAIEYFGDLKSQAQRFAFHSHRKEEEEKTIVYPINALCFHPKEGTLVSGCSGGMVNFWDLKNKNKLQPIPFQFETSVSALEFSPDGNFLAIASSYMFDKGNIEHPSDRLIIYKVTDENIKSVKQDENN